MSQIEPLEPRRLLAGHVIATVVGGDLFVRGDGEGNSIVIDQQFVAPGELRITTGDFDTIVNDGVDQQTPFVVVAVPGRVFVELRGGNDTVLVHEATIGKTLRISAGNEDDIVTITRSDLRGALFITGEAGADVISVVDTRVEGLVDIASGSGDDVVSLAGSSFNWDLRVKGGRGDDTASRGGAEFERGVAIGGGGGDNNITEGIERSYDFRSGAQGWRAEFADFVAESKSTYDLDSGIRPLPAEVPGGGTGYFLSGDNHSDDLFMYLTREYGTADGIVAGRTYQVRFNITFASNATGGAGGVGGSEGDSVYLKAGATPTRPALVLDVEGVERLNVDHGQQSSEGPAASVVDTIANGLEWTGDEIENKPYVSLERTHVHNALVTAGADGKLHVIVGTESGYEAVTAIYYQSIAVALVPVA